MKIRGGSTSIGHAAGCGDASDSRQTGQRSSRRWEADAQSAQGVQQQHNYQNSLMRLSKRGILGFLKWVLLFKYL